MPAPARLDRVTFIVLRFMRAPVLVLIVVYAVAMGVMVLIPGPMVDGEPSRLGFFHAFYFLTYTATTTGFGEIPYEFSDAQRMWAIVSLYASVIAWVYAIGAIFQLVRNDHFQRALEEWHFVRKVERIAEPFVILCGFGSTGSVLARGLSDAGLTAVILDDDPERIKALSLRDYRVTMPGLTADARNPQHLIEAGLTKPQCRAVVALTNDERVNQKVAVTAALLNPTARIVTLSTDESYHEVLAALSDRTHVIDPFKTYARFLGASLAEPDIHMLNSWILGVGHGELRPWFSAPRGKWILCGYGRMGQRVNEVLTGIGIETTIIESAVADDVQPPDNLVVGRVTAATLVEAGIEGASGIVAGTNNDYDNLAIVLTARAKSPDVFTVVRQNRHENEPVYAAAHADLIMQPSLVSARRILLLLIAPLLRTLFSSLARVEDAERRRMLDDLVERLRERVGGTHPRLWTVVVEPASACALVELIAHGERPRLADVLRDNRDGERPLPCVALVLRSNGSTTVLPADDQVLAVGDELLLCGRREARHLLDATLNNEYTLRYVIDGDDPPRGWVMRRLTRARRAADPLTGSSSRS